MLLSVMFIYIAQHYSAVDVLLFDQCVTSKVYFWNMHQKKTKKEIETQITYLIKHARTNSLASSEKSSGSDGIEPFWAPI